MGIVVIGNKLKMAAQAVVLSGAVLLKSLSANAEVTQQDLHNFAMTNDTYTECIAQEMQANSENRDEFDKFNHEIYIGDINQASQIAQQIVQKCFEKGEHLPDGAHVTMKKIITGQLSLAKMSLDISRGHLAQARIAMLDQKKISEKEEEIARLQEEVRTLEARVRELEELERRGREGRFK